MATWPAARVTSLGRSAIFAPMTVTELSALGGLFGTAFGAATVLPFQSEIVFAALQRTTEIPLWLLVVVASIGNTLGSVLNWWMGLFVEHWKGSRWFPVSEKQMDRAERLYQRWGVWSLLLSWAPFGDAFTVISGLMGTPLWKFVALVGPVKTARYVLLAWALT
jgi:membrane protein YqaA with SNARE-associated domain